MHLIDLRATLVLEGARHLRESEWQLRKALRFDLLREYAAARAAQKKAAQRMAWRRSFALAGLGAAGLLIVFGLSRGIVSALAAPRYTLSNCCLSPLLALAGFLLALACWVSYLQLRTEAEPPDPIHPLRSRFIEQFWRAEAWQPWWQALDTNDSLAIPPMRPDGTNDPTAQDQQAFVRQLLGFLDDSYFALARFHQAASRVIDLVLVGPQGLWLFGIVPWEGAVRWDGQEWQQQPGENPEQRWLENAAALRKTLKEESAPLLFDRPELQQLRGGLVFSAKEVRLEIEAGMPVSWGDVPFWISELRQGSSIAGWRLEFSLAVIDALLSRHRELNTAISTFSMAELASQAAAAAQRELIARLETNL
ncbi:MAG: hypothetical protein JW862_18175 [Anaerolineales bacterium]|nr:hypothetical protein [Anaerolineales bacterium]